MIRRNLSPLHVSSAVRRAFWVTLTATALAASSVAAEETAADPELVAEMQKADAALFDAFNACDLETVGKLFAEDLEFFHDLGGLTDYRQSMDNTKALCDRKLGLKRELVEGSMEVYPVPGFGAIQKGRHTFCHMENGKNDCGTFEFVHVWRRDGDSWELARVVSYGH